MKTPALLLALAAAAQAGLALVEVAPDAGGFRLAGSGERFAPWGFNYDRDDAGRLLEDYWNAEWDTVAGDFREMKALGANVVRVHLQFGRFMKTATEPDATALRQLTKLLALAEQTSLRLDVTGLACYHKADVPAWYDALGEAERWAAQARFWETVAVLCSHSSAIFCYNLMNEPVVPAGDAPGKEWLGPAFGDKHYVQYISRDRAGRDRPEIARQWVAQLTAAIRARDPRHLITVGLVDWSLPRAGLQSGFEPARIAAPLDFIAVHLYPREGKLAEDLETLALFAATGKPVVIEETFPLFGPMQTFAQFHEAAGQDAAGWIGFYWGKPPAAPALRTSPQDVLMGAWLDYFQKHAPTPPPR